MSNKKKTRPVGDATERAEETTATTNDQKFSQSNDNTGRERVQAGILGRVLPHGKGHAIPGRELVKLLKLKDLRDLTQLVEQERKNGSPVCASTDSAAPGYYLASDASELESYISSLDRRLHNIRVTRQHLEATLIGLTGQQRLGGG